MIDVFKTEIKTIKSPPEEDLLVLLGRLVKGYRAPFIGRWIGALIVECVWRERWDGKSTARKGPKFLLVQLGVVRYSATLMSSLTI